MRHTHTDTTIHKHAHLGTWVHIHIYTYVYLARYVISSGLGIDTFCYTSQTHLTEADF